MVHLLLVVGGAGFASKLQASSACVCVGKSKKQGEARRRSRQIVEVEDRVCDVSVVEFLWHLLGVFVRWEDEAEMAGRRRYGENGGKKK